MQKERERTRTIDNLEQQSANECCFIGARIVARKRRNAQRYTPQRFKPQWHEKRSHRRDDKIISRGVAWNILSGELSLSSFPDERLLRARSLFLCRLSLSAHLHVGIFTDATNSSFSGRRARTHAHAQTRARTHMRCSHMLSASRPRTLASADSSFLLLRRRSFPSTLRCCRGASEDVGSGSRAREIWLCILGFQTRREKKVKQGPRVRQQLPNTYPR